MTPLKRLVRRVLEWLLDVFHEGPDAPYRLTRMVEEFAARNPSATRRQWVEFAALHAEESYRSGWTRGYEYVERYDPPYYRPESPEAIADREAHGWEWEPPVILGLRPGDPDAVVLDLPDDDGIIHDALELGLRPPGADP